jgi:hypothetical protein
VGPVKLSTALALSLSTAALAALAVRPFTGPGAAVKPIEPSAAARPRDPAPFGGLVRIPDGRARRQPAEIMTEFRYVRRVPSSEQCLRDLDEAWRRYRRAAGADRPVLALRVDTLSIAALLANRNRVEEPTWEGLGEPPDQGRYAFTYRDNVYRFEVGEFPEHDALRARLRDARDGERERLPTDLALRIEQRRNEALAVLARSRSGP